MSSGARFVWNTRYFHIAKPGEEHSKYAKSKQEVINLVDYVATREGVSYNIENDINEAAETSLQKNTIGYLLDKFQKENINAKVYSEYNNYKLNPTRKNASELLTRLSKEILTNDAFDSTARARANLAKKIVDRYDPDKRQATEKQKSLINELINTLVPKEENQEAYLKEILEYSDYKEAPTIKNASELINYLTEQIQMSDLAFDEAANLVEYAAKRPGVVKIGEHGLFSSNDNVDLEKAKEEISTHEGNIWTHILSLRREDADKLGYDSQEPWRNLVKSKLDTLAETHQIDIKNLRWYAAMHNTGYHPHIHLFVFSTDPKEGFFSEKANESIRKCKSRFATQIFKDDRLNDYVQKDVFKNELNEQAQEIIDKLLDDPTGLYDKEQLKDITNKMLELSSKLPTHGQNEYGYMKKPIKELVNEIQKQLVNDNPLLSKLYMQYCEHKYNIEKTYVKNPKEAPIESNKDFITIKNMILKQAENLRNNIELNRTVKNSLLNEPNDNLNNNVQTETENTGYNSSFVIENAITEVSLGGTDKIENFNKNDYNTTTSYDFAPVQKQSKNPINYYLKHYPNHVFYSYEPDYAEFKKIFTKSIFKSDNADVQVFKALKILTDDFDTRNGDICFELANCYKFGIGTEKDTSLAMMWYGIASDQFNHGMASYRLGQMYLYGAEDIEIDKELGNEYCKKAFYTFKMEIKNSDFFDAIEDNIDNIKYYPNVSNEDAYKEYLMGRMYLKGEGVEQNYYKSLQTFGLAAENGYNHANYYIGNQYYYGLGVEQSYEEAINYYTKAAEQKDSYAEYKLGHMYLKGEGVKVNLETARDYFVKSSDRVVMANYELAKLYENNTKTFDVDKETIYKLYNKTLEGLIKQEDEIHDAFTEIRIANLYLTGSGAEKSIDKAIEWFDKAAQLKNPDANYQLGYIYSSKEYDLQNEQKSQEYYSNALKGYIKAEDENKNATAEYRIGKMYLEGKGTEKNIDEAVKWLNKATFNGNSNAAYSLFKLYSEGKDLQQDTEKANLYLEISAELENPYAQYALGNKELDEGNTDNGIEWLKKSAEQNISHAAYKLGDIYSSNKYVLKNDVISNEYYKKALDLYKDNYNKKPEDFISYRIAQMYLNGQGTDKNITEAVKWFEKSAQLKNPDANYQLGYIYSSKEYDLQNEQKSQEYYSNALKGYIKAEDENKNATAEYRIGKMYLEGKGTEKNIDEAVKWLNKATFNGNSNAAYSLFKLYSEGKDLQQDTEKANLYLEISAELENPYAQYALGNKELDEGNTDNGIEWLKKSAEQNISHAAYKLGDIYSSNKYVLKNDVISNEYYKKALDLYTDNYNKKPEDFISYRIAQMYFNGQGTNTNIFEAAKWFEKSAQFGNADAYYQLGYIYYKDDYGLKNNETAQQYFKKAFELYNKRFNEKPDGNISYRIGQMYNYGLGVERDIDKAVSWYKKSLELGNMKAQQKINEAEQENQVAAMAVATTICHLGNMIKNETSNMFKKRYYSDSKILKKEKIQKIYAGQAVDDKQQDFDY